MELDDDVCVSVNATVGSFLGGCLLSMRSAGVGVSGLPRQLVELCSVSVHMFGLSIRLLMAVGPSGNCMFLRPARFVTIVSSSALAARVAGCSSRSIVIVGLSCWLLSKTSV